MVKKPGIHFEDRVAFFSDWAALRWFPMGVKPSSVALLAQLSTLRSLQNVKDQLGCKRGGENMCSKKDDDEGREANNICAKLKKLHNEVEV